MSLIGVVFVMCPLERRREAEAIGVRYGRCKLAAMTSEIDLSGVMEVGRCTVEGGVRGRVVVKIG